jgi:hypothetical protein
VWRECGVEEVLCDTGVEYNRGGVTWECGVEGMYCRECGWGVLCGEDVCGGIDA